MSTGKLCSQCGREKQLFHGTECRHYQTLNIIDRLQALLQAEPTRANTIRLNSQPFLEAHGVTWEEMIACSALRSSSMDTIGINWCKDAFERYDKSDNQEDKTMILDNVISILFCFNHNVTLAIFPGCPYCLRTPQECEAGRKLSEEQLKQFLSTRIKFPPEVETTLQRTSYGLTHLCLNMFGMLIAAFEANPATGSITAVQIAILLRECHQFAQMTTLLREVDRLIDE